ncbi:DUF6221 family protein [Streptomyces sp. NPDC052225]|uniref:DUF6221 family protein n=1 Tax=Streptomyces sp. NPDC052225 TaxID=3154949 RepID=UPI00343631DD
MDDLVQWLGEQLDVDAELADCATREGRWREMGQSILSDDNMEVVTLCALEFADHIATHDPARVLSEIDAKRRIVARYVEAKAERIRIRERYREAFSDGDDGRSERCRRELHEATLRLQIHNAAVADLASVYADRPGYREEWRP